MIKISSFWCFFATAISDTGLSNFLAVHYFEAIYYYRYTRWFVPHGIAFYEASCANLAKSLSGIPRTQPFQGTFSVCTIFLLVAKWEGWLNT